MRKSKKRTYEITLAIASIGRTHPINDAAIRPTRRCQRTTCGNPVYDDKPYCSTNCRVYGSKERLKEILDARREGAQ